MPNPKTIRKLLRMALEIADGEIEYATDSKSLSDDEKSMLYDMQGNVQNCLGEMTSILSKYNLEYRG